MGCPRLVTVFICQDCMEKNTNNYLPWKMFITAPTPRFRQGIALLSLETSRVAFET